jgi:pilus assembly protein CpaB
VKARRRRGLLLLSLALASGGLAASQVRERERRVEARVGPLVPVVVAARDLAPDTRIRRGALALRRVPARFAPPDALGAAAEVTGARTTVAVVAGAYLTAGQLRGAAGGRVTGGAAGGRASGGAALGHGERAVEVAVGGGSALAEAGPGVRVDLVVSTEPQAGGGRTFLALEDVELLGLRSNPRGAGYDGASEGEPPPAGALATLRVSLRQAVYLAAAENFARELRLLVRPPGDRGRAGRAQVGEGEL